MSYVKVTQGAGKTIRNTMKFMSEKNKSLGFFDGAENSGNVVQVLYYTVVMILFISSDFRLVSEPTRKLSYLDSRVYSRWLSAAGLVLFRYMVIFLLL